MAYVVGVTIDNSWGKHAGEHGPVGRANLIGDVEKKKLLDVVSDVLKEARVC
jgi:hypothetical protein